MQTRIWRDILAYARWAPSPHNTQHWKFQLIDETHAVLMYDPSRLLPVEDGKGQFMAAGFGIILEMIDIAAAPHGLELKTTLLNVPLDDKKVGPQPFANLELVARTKAEPLDRELILTRRTSRLPYDDAAVPQPVLDELAVVAASFDHQLESSNAPEQVKFILDLNADTMFLDLRVKDTRDEIGHWTRYTMQQAKKTGDGLAAFAMLFPGWMMTLFFKANWIFQIPGIHQFCKWTYKRSMRGTKTVAWISGKFEEQADCVNAGRMLARLWLTMTKHGIYLHPFGSVITNHRSHKVMEDHFANPNRRDPLWLLVRLGQSDTPPRALRLDLEDIIVP
jgi:hypothetical protein